MLGFAVAVALTILAVAGLLSSEFRGSRTGIWLVKPLASTGFVAAVLAAGGLESGYGRCILVALVLSWWGDVLLIPRARGAFLAGLVSFLLGHVAFAAGFAFRGLDALWVGVALIPVVPASFLILRWLRPHVGPAMRAPLYAYTGVISAMVLLAAGTVGAHGRPTILLGAVAFCVSDLAVARERFVFHTFANKTWGLPLYYGAQLILASTVR